MSVIVMRTAHIAAAGCVLLAILAGPAAWAAPGGNGNGNGNAYGYGYGNGNGRSGAGGGAAGGPIPVLGVTVLGQLGISLGVFLLWRSRRGARQAA